MREKTQLIHAGHNRQQYHGASSVPIFQSSTFHQPTLSNEYDYARSGNPTRGALEDTIATLERGTQGFAFASGMAAVASSLMLFKTGDHLIVSHDIYGGTYRALTTFFKRWGLESTFVETTKPELVAQAVKKNTRGIFVETPANPLLQITDLAAIVKIAQHHNLITLIDNTFMTPLLQRPIELGFDIVIHSATKFIAGHSDLIAGLAVTRTPELGRELNTIHNGFGAILAPQDSWLTLRGLRTLSPRMITQQASAQLIAEWLQNNPKVNQVNYPGLPSHPGFNIHNKQAHGAGAVLSFELAESIAPHVFMQRLKLPLVAVSLGGTESILSYPAGMSHAAMPPEERLARGITPGLVRLSVGLEDPLDLIDDLKQALS